MKKTILFFCFLSNFNIYGLHQDTLLKNTLLQLETQLTTLEKAIHIEALKNSEIVRQERERHIELEQKRQQALLAEKLREEQRQEQRRRDKEREEKEIPLQQERQEAERIRLAIERQQKEALKQQRKAEKERQELLERERLQKERELRELQLQQERETELLRQLELEQKKQEEREKAFKERVEKRRLEIESEVKKRLEEHKKQEKEEIAHATLSYSDIDIASLLAPQSWAQQLFDELHLREPINKAYFWGGYVFLTMPSLMKGKRSKINIKEYDNARLRGSNSETAVSDRRALAGQYKIHLMPKNENDLMIILKQFLQGLQNDSELQNSVHDIKFKPTLDFSQGIEKIKEQLKDSQDAIMPIIVIYPSEGKKHAQKVLDVMYKLFKDMDGLNITPRYNKKITSLIYYAQGDADLKLNFPEYYTDDLIFYRPDFEGEDRYIDYHLKNPQTIIMAKNKK